MSKQPPQFDPTERPATGSVASSEKAGLRLAIPTSAEVEEFKNLYQKRFSIHLSSEEALFVATHYLHMFQILTYEDPD